MVCNIDNHGWVGTPIWLNGTSLGEIKSTANPYYGPISAQVTDLLKAGTNTLTIRVRGEAGVNAPVFLTTTKPMPYPYLGKYANSRYVDCLEWRLHALNFKVADAMAYARSLDPERPLILDASGADVRDFQSDLLRQYGGSMQNTGYESSYMPFNSRLGYADGFYGSCEVSGIQDLGDPSSYIPRATRRLSWTLFNTEGMYKEWRDPSYYYDIEKRASWLTQSKRQYQLIGKMLPEQPKLGMFFSSESALLNYDGHSMWDWDLGRGELQSNHFDHVYVTDAMLRQGLGDDYPVLIDTDTLTMDAPTLDAIRRYVENGGTFVVLQNSRRNSLLEGDSWPISRSTGFRVVGAGKTGTIKLGKDLPILKAWAGKEFNGFGTALDWQSNDSAKGVSIAMTPEKSDDVSLAKWDDGTVAVGMRRLGKGRIVVLGSNFWRYGSDVGGTGQLKAGELEGRFLNDFLPDLGITRNANASSGALYARKTVTKNGLQNWLIAMNSSSTETTGDVGMAVGIAPKAVWDVLTGAPVEFAYNDGWVWIKSMTFPAYGTRIFGVHPASGTNN